MNMNWNEIFIYNADGSLTRRYSNNQHNTVGWINSSGYRGVVRTKNNKFQARLTLEGKKLYLGLFDTPKEAFDCVETTRKELYGEFATLR
jgi:hypothetical protein